MGENCISLSHLSVLGSRHSENALLELKEAWEAMKESYEKHNEPVPIAPSKKGTADILTSGLINVFTEPLTSIA